MLPQENYKYQWYKCSKCSHQWYGPILDVSLRCPLDGADLVVRLTQRAADQPTGSNVTAECKCHPSYGIHSSWCPANPAREGIMKEKIIAFLRNEYANGFLLEDPDTCITHGFVDHLAEFIYDAAQQMRAADLPMCSVCGESIVFKNGLCEECCLLESPSR